MTCGAVDSAEIHIQLHGLCVWHFPTGVLDKRCQLADSMNSAESTEPWTRTRRAPPRPHSSATPRVKPLGPTSRGRGPCGQVEMVFRSHGGKRPGAGRKPTGKRSGAPHEARAAHDPRHPVHVTTRVVGSVEGLRRRDIYLGIREATIVTAKREDFRIIHISIQHDHLHMIVEAQDTGALSRGIRGFSISAARQINKAITARGGDRRTGRVISDRFHARPLTSPRAVRNTLSYVLNNWRRHQEDRAPVARAWKVDPFSSGPLFFDWQELESSLVLWPLRPTYLPLIVFRPRTWLLQSWNRFHPLISVWEVPGR